MKNLLRATLPAIFLACAVSIPAHATTEVISGCDFDLSYDGFASCDVLVGGALGQLNPQFYMDYEGVTVGPAFWSEVTFVQNPFPGGSVGASFLWRSDVPGISYRTESRPVDFQINGIDYAGTANFKLTGNVFSLASVTYGQTGGSVPEPASWAMMIIGVGAAGTALRRARRQTAAAA